MIGTPGTVSLSLVSHTNVGKTTLARTLLGRDVGEVRDAAHVTETADSHVLAESSTGDRLLLWDTPGFGDSLRLAKRLAHGGKPWGWFLTEVWDRWRDRPFWSAQRVLQHVMAECDVVLYLVNAAEEPEDATYLNAELQVLGLLGKPVVALLNQLGAASGSEAAAAEDALVLRWQVWLRESTVVRAVLPLDAFTHCWVQEGALWQAVAPCLPAAQQPVFARLQAAWQQRQQEVWQAATDELARRITRAALDHAPVDDEGWRGPLRTLGQAVGKALGLGGDRAPTPTERAMAALAQRLDEDLRQSTDALVKLHGLDGRAATDVAERLANHYALRVPLDEGRAALWGGVVTGALAGLKADIASGGLTLGGGLLVGGVLGALGAAGAVRGVNKVRGLEQAQVAWDAKVLEALVSSALLGYLAVAHHGRGRGAWVAAAPPPAWTTAVAAVVLDQPVNEAPWWRDRQQLLAAAPGSAASAEAAAFQLAVAAWLRQISVAVLVRLYPQAEPPRLLG